MIDYNNKKIALIVEREESDRANLDKTGPSILNVYKKILDNDFEIIKVPYAEYPAFFKKEKDVDMVIYEARMDVPFDSNTSVHKFVEDIKKINPNVIIVLLANDYDKGGFFVNKIHFYSPNYHPEEYSGKYDNMLDVIDVIKEILLGTKGDIPCLEEQIFEEDIVSQERYCSTPEGRAGYNHLCRLHRMHAHHETVQP